VNPTPPCNLRAIAGPDLPIAALWVDSGPGDRVTLCVSLPHLQALARFSSQSAGRLHDTSGGIEFLGFSRDAAIDSRWDLALSP
jgi:hypothetical protein